MITDLCKPLNENEGPVVKIIMTVDEARALALQLGAFYLELVGTPQGNLVEALWRCVQLSGSNV